MDEVTSFDQIHRIYHKPREFNQSIWNKLLTKSYTKEIEFIVWKNAKLESRAVVTIRLFSYGRTIISLYKTNARKT